MSFFCREILGKNDVVKIRVFEELDKKCVEGTKKLIEMPLITQNFLEICFARRILLKNLMNLAKMREDA